MSKLRDVLKRIGPGIITGASDNDASAITAFSIAGARYGFLFLWLPILLFPTLLIFVFLFSVIANHTGKGFSDIIRSHYPPVIFWGLCVCLSIANTFQIGANLGGIASLLEKYSGIYFIIWIVIMAGIIIFVLIKFNYEGIKSIFKWFTLVLLTYIVAGIFAGPEWSEVIPFTVNPQIKWEADYFYALLGVTGSALSPYLFFWQTNLVVEEKRKITQKQ